MAQNMDGMPGAVPAAPPPKRTNWLLIGGIVVGVIALCVCLVCVAPTVAMTMAGPQIGAQFLGILCGIQYSNLTSDQCSAWANDIMTNHQQEYLECSNQSQGSSGTDSRKLFTCLEDKGLGPKK